jgi:hypothetical protein
MKFFKTKNLQNRKSIILLLISMWTYQGCLYPGCEHHNVTGDALNATTASKAAATQAEIVPETYPSSFLSSQRVIDLEDGRPKTTYSQLLYGSRMKRADNSCDYWISTEIDLEPLRKRFSDAGKNLKDLNGDEIKVGEKVSTTIKLRIGFRDGPSASQCGIQEQYGSYTPIYYTKTVDLEIRAFQKQNESHDTYNVSSLNDVKEFLMEAVASIDFEHTLVGDFHYETDFKVSIINQVLSSWTTGDCS